MGGATMMGKTGSGFGGSACVNGLDRHAHGSVEEAYCELERIGSLQDGAWSPLALPTNERAHTHQSCPFCVHAKSLLESKAANATIVELNRIPNGSALQLAAVQLTGHRTVPSIWVNGTFVGGFDALSQLDQQGRLEVVDTKRHLSSQQ
jgi:glutaredoxin 3